MSKAKFPPVSRRRVLQVVPSGEISLECGEGGPHLRFDCSCDDALPFCQAACCALHGITIQTEEELARLKELGACLVGNHEENTTEMQRGSDGYCRHNCQDTRRCLIYEDRPKTCREFHCTRKHDSKGFQLVFNRFG